MKLWLPVLIFVAIGCGVSETALTSSDSTNTEAGSTDTAAQNSTSSVGTTIGSSGLTTSNTSVQSEVATQPPTTTTSTTTRPTTTVTPRDQPDCSNGCNVVLEGDSLTKGLGSRVCNRLDTASCLNSGISGATVSDMISTAPNDVDNLDTSGNKDVLILFGGTNDLWLESNAPNPAANATQTHQILSAYVAARKNAGWDYIFIATLPPVRPSIQSVGPLNQLIRTDRAGADEVIDLGADQRFDDPFDTRYRDSDGVHFVDGGADIVSFEYFAPAISG